MFLKKKEIMNAKEQLNSYIAKHPDYWDFENETREVERLKELCKEEFMLNSI